MTAYTDAPITITLEGGSLTGATDVHVTFSQPFAIVDVTDAEVLDANNLQLTLMQEQTGSLKMAESCDIQVNWLDSNNKRKATDIATIPVLRNLLERVLTNG